MSGTHAEAEARDQTADTGPLLRLDPATFRERFNKRHFVVEHGLAEHAAFALPRLVELAALTARTRPQDVYCDEGEVEAGQRWTQIASGELPVDQTIERLATRKAWIMLWRSDLVEPYGTLLNRALSDIFALTGRQLERDIKKREVILFITSPKRVTPYHIDRECNFLLQISGTKQISVFPNDDRELLPEQERESFWAADNNAAVYRPQLQARAEVIAMRPGNGVHIPVNAPHWVRNDDNISVTASFNFQFHDRVYADLYRANYYLRKIGLSPMPPFRNALVDAAKRPLGAALYRARRAYRGPTHHSEKTGGN